MRRLAPTALIAAALFSLAACSGSPEAGIPELSGPDPTGDTPPSTPAPAPDARDTTPPAEEGGIGLVAAVQRLPIGPEKRSGYDRDLFKHWTDDDGDGCDTRDEVLTEQAVEAPEVGEDCALSGGRWLSSYDDETVTDSSDLDIDHMVPLAEAWDSGAFAWSDERRERFANDVVSLVAVTAGSNRSKSDQDPAEWLPPDDAIHCSYAAAWTKTKLRWKLSADEEEAATLNELAADCPDTTVPETAVTAVP